ncbi:hypothetical protein Tco_0886729 [Tanacetum coccineum]
MSTTKAESKSQMYLDELELGVIGFIIVIVCRVWDVSAVTGRYLSTYFVISDAKPNKDEFRIFKNVIFIVEFNGETSVRKAFVKSDGFIRYPFQLVALENLKPTNNKYLIDVVGGQAVRVTLWGGLGEMLIEKRTYHVGLYPNVLTALSVKHYNNRLYLFSSSSTLIIDDDSILALKQMKTDQR